LTTALPGGRGGKKTGKMMVMEGETNTRLLGREKTMTNTEVGGGIKTSSHFP